MSSRALSLLWALVALVVFGTIDTGPLDVGQAHAVIGRPLTPVSYAGVARRTTRRHVAATSGYYGGAYYGGAAAYAAATVALPPGCPRLTVAGALYYGCGGRYYQPVYDGPNVTYVIVDKP